MFLEIGVEAMNASRIFEDAIFTEPGNAKQMRRCGNSAQIPISQDALFVVKELTFHGFLKIFAGTKNLDGGFLLCGCALCGHACEGES